MIAAVRNLVSWRNRVSLVETVSLSMVQDELTAVEQRPEEVLPEMSEVLVALQLLLDLGLNLGEFLGGRLAAQGCQVEFFQHLGRLFQGDGPGQSPAVLAGHQVG